MLNNYAESSGGFSNNHGQPTRTTAEAQKQQNIGSTWGYNSQLEGMYYGAEPQPMFMGPYEGSTKHSNYTQYPTGTIHQPVPTPVVKCHEACCQHYQDHRYPINPAPLRYQPSGPIQPRYADLPGGDSRQYYTDRRPIQSGLSRKKVYPPENGYQNISDRHFPQYMGRGQMHMADSRQQMQMMRSQYPMYPPYWPGGARGWTGPRLNCPPPPPYHQSVNQGAQLQSGLKMSDTAHYLDPTTQKTIGSQHRRGVSTSSGGTEIIRPVPEPKRSTLNPNLQSCHEFGYPTGFVPFSEVNKGVGMPSQSNNSTCKIPTDKQYHPHQMQYPMQGTERNMMNCSNSINDLGYSMNFPMVGSDSYIRPGIDDNQQISDVRKLQYDTSLGKKRPDLDLRQYLSTWEDDEDESTRLTDSLNLGNSAAPYIVVDCRSLEGEGTTKLQERYKTAPPSQGNSKSRSSSPNTSKRADELPQQNESSERGGGIHSEFQTQTSYNPSIPALLNDSEKSFWNGTREGEGILGKGGAFQPLDCSKRDANIESKRNSHPHNDMSLQKMPSNNESANMSFDALVSFYGDNRRTVDGGYDFVEMTERLVNNSEKSSTNNRSSLDQHPEISRPCDPRLQQSQLGNNPSIYNKVAPRYPANNYQHFKPNMAVDPYYNYKHPMATSKYFGFDNSQMVDPNYDYHKIISEFDSARLLGSKEPSKDPRRMFHPELDKSLESAFIDPLRKTQLDCFQDKTNLEFASVDPDQFMTPIIMKKSDLDNRIDKNSAIRERMEAINNENRPEKTVLITSQNGPSEIFRVPYSPEKDLSGKDNVVTLHSGDQTKTNTITVEVPYVQQYSSLVKLSETISRSDNNDKSNTNKVSESSTTTTESTEDFKKPTSFKLKRLPNSKEWTVAEKNCSDINRKTSSDDSTTALHNDLPLPVSNLNMPSLDDIRDGDETCETTSETNLDKVNIELVDPTCDSNKILTQTSKHKNNSQTPQMAVVQPMKLNPKSGEIADSNSSSNICDEGNLDNSVQSVLNSVSPKSVSQVHFESDKISSDSSSQIELMTESKISKHDNFRSHKKIQNVSNVPNCLSSPNEEFLNPQDLNPVDGKETYSPFHDYSDCDMNSHISDYFKLDERSASDKILDTRMPSSPGVDGMFEDINHSNPEQLYQSKSCNFQDLTDPNMVSIDNHNTDFQSFSNIFSEESDKGRRSDGSVLQMNDKKYLKEIFDDIDNQQVLNSLQEQASDKTESQSEENVLHDMCNEMKTSPPIPPISLKLNEAKKIWCIAKKDQENSSQQRSTEENLSPENNDDSEINLANLQDKNINSNSNSEDSFTNSLKEKEHNYCFDKENKSIINQLIFNRVKETNDNHNSIAKKSDLNHKTRSEQNKSQLNTNSVYPNNDLYSNIENQCRTVVRYHPKLKILHKLKSVNTINSKTEALVFNEEGVHFPKQHETENVQNENSKTIVQDILEDIITQSVNVSKMTVDKMIIDLPDSFQSNEANLNEGFIDPKSNLSPQSVITFDNSRSLIHRQNCITTTTEVFNQYEKDNNQHQSVIPSFQTSEVGCNLIVKKNAVRSIFSPMSEDNEEDIANVNSKDNTLQIESNVVNQLVSNRKNLFNLNEGHHNVEGTVLDCIPNKSVISIIERNSIGDLTEKEEICKANLKERKNYDDEVFRGFGSPNNASCNNREEFIPKKVNFEIDDALELMGLCSDNNEAETGLPLSPKHHSNLLQISLQNDAQDEKLSAEYDNNSLVSSPANDNSNISLSNKYLPSETTEQNERNNTSSCISTEQICDNITLNTSQEIVESISSSNITDKSVIEEVKLIEEKSNNSNSESKKNQLVTQLIETRVEAPKTNPNNLDDNLSLSPPTDLPSEETSKIKHLNNNEDNSLQISQSKRCRKRTISDTVDVSTTTHSKISKQITSLTQETSESDHCSTISNNNMNSNEGKPITKASLEEFETRLETSVIVRNNLSNSIISKSPILPTPIQSTEGVHSLQHNDEQLEDDSAKDFRVHYKENTIENDHQEEIDSLNYNIQEKNNLELKNTFNKANNIISEDKESNEGNILVANQIQVTSSNIADSQVNPLKNRAEENIKHYLSYCAGESAFLSFDEETKELLKTSKLSYFYEFKRNKWKRFTRNCKNQCLSNNSQVNQVEKISIRSKDTPHSPVNNILYPFYNDATQNKINELASGVHQLQAENVPENDHSPFLENVQSALHLLNSTEISHPSEFVNKQNIPITKDCLDKIEETGINEPQLIEEISNDIKSHSLNKDSLKIIETETILEEIFCSDPDVNDSGNLNVMHTKNVLKGSPPQNISEEDSLTSEETSKIWSRNSVLIADKETHVKSNNSEEGSVIELTVVKRGSTNDETLVNLSQQSGEVVNDDKTADNNDGNENSLDESLVNDTSNMVIQC